MRRRQLQPLALCRAAGAAARLNDLDAQCGDGDTGSQFALGAEAVAAWLVGPGSQAGSAAALLEGTARVLRKAKGGTSGAGTGSVQHGVRTRTVAPR